MRSSWVECHFLFSYRSSWTVYTFRSLYCIYQSLQEKHSIATITQLRSLELLTAKHPLLHMLYCMNWLTHDFLDPYKRVGVWSLPWHWHILSMPLTTGRGTSAESCGLDDVFPPDDLGSHPEALCLYIYIYMHFLYEFCYRTYINIQQECHSVLVKLHPIRFYRTVFLGSAKILGLMPLFVFFGLLIVSCSLMIIV